MAKKKVGGKRKKRGKKVDAGFKRNIDYKSSEPSDNQQYALILTNLGERRFQVLCEDRQERICNVRGKFRKRVWIKIGNLVIVSLRSFQMDKCDLLHRYNDDEARMLAKTNVIPKHLVKVEDEDEDQTDQATIFVEEDEIAPQPMQRHELLEDELLEDEFEKDWQNELDDL